MKVKDGRSPATSDFPVVAVAVPCAVVLLILVVIVLVLFLKRSKPQNNKKYRVSTKRKENEIDDVTNTEKMEKDIVIDPVDTAPEKRFVDETKDNSDDLGKGTKNPLYSELNKDKEATVDLESD